MNISAFNPGFTPKKSFFVLAAFFLFLIAFETFASNTASEKRWAEQLRDNIVIGDPVDITPSGTESSSGTDNTFFSIFTPETTASPKGAIILMHGTGAHPDWPDIIHPLRSELPDRGWATLSIQLPLVSPDKKDKESREKVIESSVSRIEAAIKFLKSKSYNRVVIVSHSFGTLMALNFLQLKAIETNPDKTPIINAAVIIGAPSSNNTIPLNSPLMVEKINIPLLDMYGSNDLDSVMRSAKARKTAAAKAGNKQYRQVETIGANHFYHGLNDELVSYVYHWLSKTFSGSMNDI